MHNTEKRFLSDIQYAFLLGRQSDHALGGVSCHIYLETQKHGIDIDKLEAAWNSLPYRHKGLCTRISETGEISYTSPAEVPCTIWYEHLEELDEEACKHRLSELRNTISSRLTDLSSGEHMGLRVCILPMGEYRLLFDFDCTAFDITSVQIILRDLAFTYAGKELPKVSDDIFLPENVNSQAKSEAREYWSKKAETMGCAPFVNMQSSKEFKSRSEYTAHSRCLNKEITAGLRSYCETSGYPMDTVLLTLFAMAVSEVSDEKHFVLNIPTMSRKGLAQDMKNAVTDTTEILIFDVDLMEVHSFDEAIKKLSRDIAADRKHSALSGLKVQRLRKNKEPSVTFSSHTEIDLLDKVFIENLGELVYMVSQTPMVAMDSIFFTCCGMLNIALVTQDGFYYEGTEEKLLDAFERNVLQLTNNKEKYDMPTLESTAAQIRQIYAEILERKDIDTSKTFNELGGDSLRSSQLQFEIKKCFGVKMSFRELFTNGSVDKLSELIYEKIKANGEINNE